MLDFGRRKRRYKAAVAAYDEARLDYEQAVMAGFGDVSTAATNMRKAAETVELRRDLRDASLEYVRLAHTQYRAGALNYLDVLDA